MLHASVLGPPDHEYEAIQTFHVPSDERRRLMNEKESSNEVVYEKYAKECEKLNF